MYINRKLVPALLALAVSGICHAAPTAEEIEQLGTTLTPWGAEKAGNADGTIPEYTGGIEAPANYDPNRPSWRPDPFPDDEVVVRIDAKNMEEYKERLTPGTMELMKKHPSYYINVYQTRRSAGYTQDVLDNSIKNASRCATMNGPLGLDTSNGCGFGIPFPLPKNGLEVMWNHDARYAPPYLAKDYRSGYTKTNGEYVLTGRGNGYKEASFYSTRSSVPDSFFIIRAEYVAPTRLNGTNNLWHDMLKDSERRSYAYQPATRRVRLSPDSAADAPVPEAAGAMTFDDDHLFAGKKDRYDWELVGKKEIYIPYNNYRALYPEEGECRDNLNTPYFLNPECIRWELRRVWHVRATLLEGKRHVYGLRDIFIEEDSYNDGIAENYDKAGNLYRINQQIGAPVYEVPAPSISENYVIDMISGIYMNTSSRGGHLVMEPLPMNRLSAESLDRAILNQY